MILSYFCAAATIWRLSQVLCDVGFSTYTSLPAWAANTVINACV
jgi:hypothetical protein